MIPCTSSGGTPNVGGHSDASSTPSRPEVPVPDVEEPPARAQTFDDSVNDARDIRQHEPDCPATRASSSFISRTISAVGSSLKLPRARVLLLG